MAPRKPFVLCDVCGQGFSSNSHFLSHMREQHSEDKPFYECETCKKQFSRKHCFKRHSASCQGPVEKPKKTITCNTCSNVFSEVTSNNLNRHMDDGCSSGGTAEPELVMDAGQSSKPPVKPILRSRNWMFTLSSEDEQYIVIKKAKDNELDNVTFLQISGKLGLVVMKNYVHGSIIMKLLGVEIVEPITSTEDAYSNIG